MIETRGLRFPFKAFTAALAIVGVASAAWGGDTDVKTIAWAVHPLDVDYIRRVVDLGAEYGINELHMMDVVAKHGSQLPETDEQAAEINEVVAYAHEHGIRALMWTHELCDIPAEFVRDGRVDLESDELAAYLTDRYEKLFARLPELDGVVLTLRESDVNVQDDGRVHSASTPADRVRRIVDAVNAACRAHDRTLVVRDFSVTPDEMENIIEAMRALPEDVLAETKWVARDWHQIGPFNPALGRYGDRPQLVEFDLGNEYYGQAQVPYTVVSEVKTAWDHAHACGVAGAVGRVDRFSMRVIDFPVGINLYAFCRFVREPGLDEETVWTDYFSDRYPAAAVPRLVSAYRRSYEIGRRMYLIDGFYFLNDHSAVPRLDYAEPRVHRHSLAIWRKEYQPAEDELAAPTRETRDRVLAEKDEAVRLARASVSDIDAVRDELDPADYQELVAYFRLLYDCAKLWRTLTAAYFDLQLYRAEKADDLLAAAREDCDLLLVEADRWEKKYGHDFELAHQRGNHAERIRRFAADVQTALLEARGLAARGETGHDRVAEVPGKEGRDPGITTP